MKNIIMVLMMVMLVGCSSFEVKEGAPYVIADRCEQAQEEASNIAYSTSGAVAGGIAGMAIWPPLVLPGAIVGFIGGNYFHHDNAPECNSAA